MCFDVLEMKSGDILQTWVHTDSECWHFCSVDCPTALQLSSLQLESRKPSVLIGMILEDFTMDTVNMAVTIISVVLFFKFCVD